MLQLSLLPSCFVFCACVCVCVVGVEWTRLTLINRLFMCAFFSSFVFIVSVCVWMLECVGGWLSWTDMLLALVHSDPPPPHTHTNRHSPSHHTHTHTATFVPTCPCDCGNDTFFSATLRNGCSWVWIHTVRHIKHVSEIWQPFLHVAHTLIL